MILNWVKFFFLSFFSNKRAKEGIKKGFSNLFLSLIIALVFICLGVIGADTMPFSAHYDSSTGFKSVVQNAFAGGKITVMIENGKLRSPQNGNDGKGLVVDTFNRASDKEIYSANGYDLVVDTRASDTLAKVEAYCVSTADENQIISYEEYLTLNEVSRLNFEFRLRYTGEELTLTSDMVDGFKSYLDGNADYAQKAKDIADKFTSGEITKQAYDREIYGLFFQAYYPSITKYESNSKVPLLRNYYFHELINKGKNRFLMTFDDCLVGSFVTDSGIEVFFYGFYSKANSGKLIASDMSEIERINAVDSFIKKSFMATQDLSVYIYVMNTIRLIPIIALMVVVVTMLMHSVLSLYGVETCPSFGSSAKVVGSFLWFSGVITALITIIIAFFTPRGIITTVSIISFFTVMLVRVTIFVIDEVKKRKAQIKALIDNDLQNTEA